MRDEMQKALDDIHILDLTGVQAGPSCSQMLAFLGADVIKLEDTRGEDKTRREMAHRSRVDSVFNNSKRSMTPNLKTRRGREIFADLMQWADVVLENFSKGVMDRLGFGYERLKEINNGIIHASIKGFGEWGPYSDYKSSRPLPRPWVE
jgi:formyl-CoA transferase